MPAEPSQPSLTRRLLVLAAKLAFSAALLALLFTRVDVAKLWASARQASLAWLAIGLVVYMVNVIISVWRWWLLLHAQDVPVPFRTLSGSMLVALFFNNFLPSNIGGDVIRIADTAKPARSKTTAATVVLVDRTMGMMGLVLIAAVGATMAAGRAGHAALPIWPSWLWAGFLGGVAVGVPVLYSPALLARVLQPLTVIHPEWVGGRIDSVTGTLERFRNHPGALLSCFSGAVLVQVATVAMYLAVARALGTRIGVFDLAIIVPLAAVVQMVPVSVNGFGVREAMFSFYFTRIGLPIEAAILMSLTATALVMLISLSGAGVYVARGHH